MNKFKVGNLKDIAELRSRVVQVQGKEIAVFRLSDGSLRAVENSCPHKGGPLSEGIICDHLVFCPLHDWQINLNDGNVMDPDAGCVEQYDVEVDSAAGDIYITLGHKSAVAPGS